MPRDFRAALQQADEQLLAPGMPRSVRVRLDARLFAPPERRSSKLLSAVVVLASVLVGFGLVQLVVPPRPVVEPGGFSVQADAMPRVQITREAAVELSAGVQVVDRARGTELSALARSTVRRESRGIRLLAGQVVFAVAKRAPDAGPVRVLVSAGSIEVHGTRFTVIESGDGRGSVELHEGAIVFVDGAGGVHQVRPGETLRWPLVTKAELEDLAPLAPLLEAPVPVQTPRVAPRVIAEPVVDWRAFDQRVHAEAVITELSQLRRQGAWDDAVRLLERELDRGAPDTRERLSFELGLILTWQVKDPAQACAHWALHRREYPEGRFDAEVDRATSALRCAP